jgi:PhzF family phenazine biosynthesis protein
MYRRARAARRPLAPAMPLYSGMAQSVVVVDAFTDAPFSGNPAAVCVMPAARDEPWMQRVAREMNLSETAFLHPDGGAYRLRWFTPTVEVALCGHATLASAHVLWDSGAARPGEALAFETQSGRLTARRDAKDWIELDFPATTAEPAVPPPNLLEALGVRATMVARSVFDYVVEVANENTVRTLQPDLALLATLPVRGVVVTAPATTPGFDFVSRFFAPASGVPEDPVTGSAHACLGPWWEARLGRSDLLAYQASPRGGIVRVGVRGDRVLLGGKAVTVMKGELVIP